ADERELSERLGALVDVSAQTRVGLPEQELLAVALDRVRQAYGDVRIGLVAEGRAQIGSRAYEFDGADPVERDGRIAFPLTVKSRLAGELEVPLGRARQDRARAPPLAGLLPSALET